MLLKIAADSETRYFIILSMDTAFCWLFCCPRNSLAEIGSCMPSIWLRRYYQITRSSEMEHCTSKSSQDNEGETFRAECQEYPSQVFVRSHSRQTLGPMPSTESIFGQTHR